jgi:MFS family permease
VARDLRLLAGAVFLSAAGDLMALIVLALEVHERTGSGLAVSALFATTLVPVVALAPLAGLVADRVESVRVIVAASLAQALAAAALAFTGDLAGILALSALLTAGNAFGQPAEFALAPAVSALTPSGPLRSPRSLSRRGRAGRSPRRPARSRPRRPGAAPAAARRSGRCTCAPPP